MIIIGVDPDAKANGVAVYMDGTLTALHNASTMRFFEILQNVLSWSVEVHIENVNGVSAAFNARDKRTSMAAKLKMAQHIGMCKHAQIEIERVCEHFGVKVVHHPISSMWKKDKAQFKKVTGWIGRSNEDTRSAAYMGWLGVKMNEGKK